MTALIATVFLASLLGSLHCAGMCGAFLAIALGDGLPGARPRVGTQAAYHLGRLATYLTLGAIAGALGSALNLAGALAGIQPLATALAGVTVVAFGVISYLRLRGWTIPLHPPQFLAKLSGFGLRHAMNRSVYVRAGSIGLLTTLLPCGWLYAFVATAAGTASPGLGALTMLAFWLGTLPVMVALGTGLRGAFGALGQRIPALTCGAMVFFGLLTLSGRLHLAPSTLMAGTSHVAAVHSAEAPVVPSPDDVPACCRKEQP